MTLFLLFACLFVSAADGYLCPDCSPQALVFPNPHDAPHSASDQAFSNGPGGSGQGCHGGMCPVCLSPLLVGNAYAPTFISSAAASSQGFPRLFAGVAATIYKPPRFPS